jgi:pimeloyl-ACP methyl ester carboxylesterase
VAIALLGAINAVLARYNQYSRSDLGIQSEERCQKPQIANLWRMQDGRAEYRDGKIAAYYGYPDYNAEMVADYFGVYAAYSHNSYPLEEQRRFDLRPELFGWSPQGSVVRFGGFHADVYHWDRGDRLSVLVAFRGTQFGLSLDAVWDWISNLSWATQMLNPWDQYRTARSMFMKVRTQARRTAGDRLLDFLVVGHSLGGGLARHIQAAFPCTSAITFNASPVANHLRLKEPYTDGTVVALWEDEDLLSWLGQRLDPRGFFRINDRYQWYRMRVPEQGYDQHGIRIAAAGMARIRVVCLADQGKRGCELAAPDYGLGFPERRQRSAADIMKLYCLATPTISDGAKADKRNLCRPPP